MKNAFLSLLFLAIAGSFSQAQQLVYHTIQKDSNGYLLPWYNPDPGTSYDHDLGLIWNYWNNIPDSAGIKFYMLDHSYSPTIQYNMIGGDQLAMAISSEELLYTYTGDTAVLNNMVYIANMYMANSLSAPTDSWPNIPYPCNMPNPKAPVYHGDYLGSDFSDLASGVAQPDKAGSMGAEFVTLYKITGDTNYLHYAVNIANTLAEKVQPGDSANSPYLFRVTTVDGSNPSNTYGTFLMPPYCGNVSPTMRLFENLMALNVGNVVQYDTAYNMLKRWVRQYPENTHQWGNFFEDIPAPSNTEINAVTMAYYILQHPDWSSTYQQEARSILDWTYTTFADTAWDSLGVTAIYEQSADLKPGGSHTSRYASAELLYANVTGDTTRVPEAIRELNWATYLTDTSGQTGFSPSETTAWFTDGYGDYVRHFLRSMYSYPTVAPDSSNHLLGTTSVITYINYQPQIINYTTWDTSSTEVLRVTSIPLKVKLDGMDISQLTALTGEGWTWTPYNTGGVLTINHTSGHNIEILWTLASIPAVGSNEGVMQLSPNPAAQNVKINYSAQHNEPVNIEVLDVLGRRVLSLNTMAAAGGNTTALNIADLLPGAYIVPAYFVRWPNGQKTGCSTIDIYCFA